MLVKSTPGVNFTNILCEAVFARKSFCTAFLCSLFGFVIFQKEIEAKASCKMLVKWTTNVNLANEQLFHMKMIYTAFPYKQFGFVIFWMKENQHKNCLKIWVKMTTRDLSKGLISFEGKSVINKCQRKRLSLFLRESEEGTFKIQEQKKWMDHQNVSFLLSF